MTTNANNLDGQLGEPGGPNDAQPGGWPDDGAPRQQRCAGSGMVD